MAVRWNDSFKFGHLDLDGERRELFELASQFARQKDIEVARAVVARLTRYANGSFAKEERLMQAAGYRDAVNHARHHEVLATHVNNLLLSELTAPGTRANAAFVIKVATVLEMWIFNHFMTEDPKVRPALARFVDRRRQG